MGAFDDFLVRQVEPLWHKRPIGYGVGVVAGIAAGWPAGSVAVGVFAFVLPVVLWHFTHYIPKVERGKVGVLISITADDEAEPKRVQSDFVTNLQKLLQSDSRGFQILQLPAFACQSIGEDGVRAKAILDQTRGHFILYGRARKRIVQGKDVHLLNLDAAVRHVVLPQEVQQRFAGDISQALPRKVMLPEDNSVFGFEVASQLAEIGARYTMGLAAFVSWDLEYAEQLLTDVEQRLGRNPPKVPGIQHIARSVPELLKQLYTAWMIARSDHWYMTRDDNEVAMMDKLADKLLARDATDYGSLIAKALGHFVLRRDVAGAHHVLQGCQSIREVTWRYSEAFLYAYEGKLDDAHDMYRAAFRGQLMNPTIPVQCEDFIQRVLDAEPDKQQLHFCLGLLNYNMKKDHTAADKDFENFLKWPGSTNFPRLQELARNLQNRCRQHQDGPN